MTDRRDEISVDARAWPRVVMRWPSGVRSDREVVAALDELRAIGRRGEAHTLLVDARGASAPTSGQLGRILEVMRRVRPGARCVAIAIATRSACVRAAIDSIRWMHLTPARWSHFDDLDAASEWLDECLANRPSTAPSTAHRSASSPPPPG